MAVRLSSIILNNSFLSRNLLSGLTCQGVRLLFTESALGVDGFSKTRERIKGQFASMGDKFKSKMNEFVSPDATNMIFTEDLKNMVHLAENEKADIELVINMIKRFNKQNKEMRFGNFVFGPVVMRMFYFLNKPEVAFETFKDPELEGFFDQLVSYQIILDLLYKNGKYQEVLDCFDIIKTKQIQIAKFPKNGVVLTLAACYKMNTTESYSYAMDLWKELQTVGHIPMRRATTFAAALAIKQNAPHVALEILSGVRQQNYMTVRNLKVIALADVGRPEDALPILRSVLEIDDPSQKKLTFTKDTLEKMRRVTELSNNKELQREFQQIEKRLIDYGNVNDSSTDDILCTPIEMRTYQDGNLRSDRRFLAASFTRKGPAAYRSVSRPGLSELY